MCDPCCPVSCPALCYSMPSQSSCEPMCYSVPSDPCCAPRCPPKRCRSRELRSGNLMTKCDCVKRNGLQTDCLRSECRGRPLCITKPIPMCCPSKYMDRFANVTMGKPSYPSQASKGCPTRSNDCDADIVCCYQGCSSFNATQILGWMAEC